jgi:hypothetical protein
MQLLVRSLIGENCLTWDEGDKLHQRIVAALKQQEKVELNFEGVKVFASPFFNAAIGRLLKDFSRETLNASLVFRSLNPVGMHVLRQVIENSKEFYRVQEVPGVNDVIDKNASE